MTSPLQPKLKKGDLVRHTDPVWPWETDNFGVVIKMRNNWRYEAKVMWVDKTQGKTIYDWFHEKDLEVVNKGV